MNAYFDATTGELLSVHAYPEAAPNGSIAIPIVAGDDLARRMAVDQSGFRLKDGRVQQRIEDRWEAAPVAVPESVTGTQAKLALLNAGLYEAIEARILGAEPQPNGIKYRIIWDAATWYRTSPELAEIAGDMGLTAEQVDDLFRLADTL